MCALLLTAGAEVTNSSADRKLDAQGMAKKMKDDKKEKLRQEAAVIYEIMNDKDKLKQRFEDVQQRIARENRKDLFDALKMLAIFAVFFVPVIYYMREQKMLRIGSKIF